MKLLLPIMLLVSLPAMAQSYKSNCSSSGCETLQRIRGAAEGLYFIGRDNNQVSSAFVGKTTLASLSKEVLPSFFPYQNAMEGDDAKRMAAIKECVFMTKGAYGEHLSQYQATRVGEPGLANETLDFQSIAANALLRILQQLEGQLQRADPTARLQYSKITSIPNDSSFPAQYEIFAAPCALSIEWSNAKTQGQQALILRAGVTD